MVMQAPRIGPVAGTGVVAHGSTLHPATLNAAYAYAGGASGATPIFRGATTPGSLLIAFVFAVGSVVGNFPAQGRFHDDPSVTTPPLAPYSPAESAQWTYVISATTSCAGMNIGGPDPSFGFLAACYYRFVFPGETTTRPVAVSTELLYSSTAVYLYEIDTSIAPGPGVGGNGNLGIPPTATLPTLAGNVVSFFLWQLGFGHSASFAYNPASGAAVTGSLIGQASILFPGNPTGHQNDPTYCLSNGNTYQWWQMLSLPSGGSASASIVPGVPGVPYTSMNFCGISVALPAGVSLPWIPFPYNQL